MAEEMKVKCCGCDTVYDLSADMAGQIAECPVCEALFEVPRASDNLEEILQALPAKENLEEGEAVAPEPEAEKNGKKVEEVPESLKTAEEIKIKCFKCESVYELPLEMNGQIAECPVCDSTFQIPPPGKEGQILNSAPYIAEPPAAANQETKKRSATTDPEMVAAAPTSTVRLSRASIGMRPDVEDSFGVDEVTTNASSVVEPKIPDGGSASGIGIDIDGNKTNIKLTKTPPVKSRKKGFLQKLFFWKK